MNARNTDPIAIIGSGPAGLASALALRAVGYDVRIYERYANPKPAGNILNLWPPAIKALADIGVDVDDIGAPCETTFLDAKDNLRVTVHIRPEIVAEYGGGFIGMLRPDLFTRMLAALPAEVLVPEKEFVEFEDRGDHVEVRFADGSSIRTPLLIGADGINSAVRKQLWGETPIREHKLHVMGGFTFNLPASVSPRKAVVRHSRTTQGSYTGIRSHGRDGAEWWFVEAMDPKSPPPADLYAHCVELSKQFLSDLQELIANSDPKDLIRWPIRDRGEPPKIWSKGRVTLAGDAVHATSPYAAYGAGMSIVDGFFLGQQFAPIDLADTAAVTTALSGYEGSRVEHTSEQVKLAFMLGRIFHHVPAPVRPIRDFVFNHTKFLQKQVGDSNPEQISAQLDLMGEDLLHPAVAHA